MPEEMYRSQKWIPALLRLRLAAAALMIGVIATGCYNRPASNGTAPPSPGIEGQAKEVEFKTEDGWNTYADIYEPTGTARGAVILLHQRNGSALDWKSLCLSLQKAGFTAFSVDQRGAGRSVQGPGSKGDDAPWDSSQDIASAVHYLQGRGSIGLAGASYGANNALIYAAAHPDQIKAVALFSPGADYHGLNGLQAAKSWKGPVIIYHAKADSIAGDGPNRIEQACPSADKSLILFEGSRHGTDLLPDALKEQSHSPTAFFQRALK